MNSEDRKALAFHKKKHGKIEVRSKMKITKATLPLAYTPGVAAVSRAINCDPRNAYNYTMKRNSVAVVTDGSKVLGLGSLGSLAALPVMEGKAALFKELAGIDAFPICLNAHDTPEIVKTIRSISTAFGAINIEDIAAPQCFEIEEQLQDLGIPVMHDDQHATAIAVQAALINAAKITGKEIGKLRVVINGAGAAGIATAKSLQKIKTGNSSYESVLDIIVCDSGGIIDRNRKDLNNHKAEIAKITNKQNIAGLLKDAIKGADVFIGLSVAGVLSADMVKLMNKDPIVFALANPIPEIMPAAAKKAGAAIIGTGSSDFPNQVNNVLAFPGIFRGALDARAVKITDAMKSAAAYALAKSVKPKENKILPNALEKKYVKDIAAAVKKAAKTSA